MLTCVLSGTVLAGGGLPIAGASVRVRTIAPTLVGGAGIATNDLTTLTASDGSWSLTLAQGLHAQIDIPAIGIAADITIPAATSAAFVSLTLYARGTLTPATILSDHGPSLGGDLSGSSPNPVVVGIQGNSVSSLLPAAGQVLVWSAANNRWEPVTPATAVASITAGTAITVGGTATVPVVGVTAGGVTATQLGTSAAALNVGTLSGDLSGTLPGPAVAAGAITDSKVATGAGIAWTKISKSGAAAGDVGAVPAAGVIAAINSSTEATKIDMAQLQAVTESKVTNLVTDLAAKAPATRTITAGTGLTGGGDLSTDRSLAADFGAASGKVCQGNDSRLSDPRVASDVYAWAKEATKPTYTYSEVGADAAGAAAGAASTVAGNLSTHAGLSTTAHGGIVASSDSRLSDPRTPTAHATSHKNGGSDEVATATPAANAIPKAGAGGTLDAGWIPTLNQSTTGTAANLSGTPALPSGTTATTQGAVDNSTKLATTAYVDAAASAVVVTAGTARGAVALQTVTPGTPQAGHSNLAGAAGAFIAMNPSTMTADLTIPAGYNAYSAGPLTIGEGINVTVTDGGNWSVL